MRPDDVNVADVLEPAGPKVIEIDPPSAHGVVKVCDVPFGETIVAVFMAAWFTAAATTPCVAAMPGAEGVVDVVGEGADGPCPPQPARRARIRNAPEGHARMRWILTQDTPSDHGRRARVTVSHIQTEHFRPSVRLYPGESFSTGGRMRHPHIAKGIFVALVLAGFAAPVAAQTSDEIVEKSLAA